VHLSTKVRYAARAMIELAARYREEPIQLNEIACEQEISVKYLEQIMAPLRAKGFVRTQKGSRGGYHLAVDPSRISLLDIVESVEGSIAPVSCVKTETHCDRLEKCITRSVWIRVSDAIKKELQAMTLAELAEEQKKL